MIEQATAEASGGAESEGLSPSGDIGGVPSNGSETANAPLPSDWRDGLDPNIRNALDVDSIDDLAKGYVNAQSMIGNSIRIPGTDAGEEDWNKFYDRFSDVPGLARYNPDDLTSLYEAAGAPDDISGYGLEGVDEDFLSIALAAGLNREQVEAISMYNELREEDAQANATEMVEHDVNVLRQEWGLAFDRKVEEGRRAVAFLEQTAPGLSEALDSTGAGNNPAVIRVFQALGANLKEGQGFAGTHEGSTGLTPYEARQQIMEMQNNPQHPYHNGDEAAMERFLDLHRYANPE